MSSKQRFAFVKNLRHYMACRQVKQSDIVSELGVSSTTVSDWCNGKKYPRVDAMQRLADYLGVLLSDLTCEDDTASHLRERLGPALGADAPAARKLREIGRALAPPEDELIEIYRHLNGLGRDTLLGTARGLASNPSMRATARRVNPRKT